MLSVRTVRNLAFGVLVAVALVGAQKRVFASGCQDVYGTMYLNLVYCGPYTYEGEAISSMQSIAEGACWGHAYYYWHVRVGDFGGDAYYDSMWTCG